MDLRSRTIEVFSKCFEDIDFKGTFEEAIRHFAYKNYSEKDALLHFPKHSDLWHILYSGFLNDLWLIVKAVNAEIPWLKYDLYSKRLLYIGDNTHFYLYQDFIDFPSLPMNSDMEASNDAYSNARRVGVKLYFDNNVNDQKLALFYMLRVTCDGYFLPLTEKFIYYGEQVSDEIKEEELKMMIMMIKESDPMRTRAMNFLYGIFSKSELEEIRNKIKE